MFAGKFLSDNVKLVKVEDHTTAGTSAVESDSVDMAQDGGYDGVLFFTSFGTANAGNKLHAEQSADDSTFAELEGSEVSSGSADNEVFIDIHRPRERYVLVEATRGASSTLESIWAVLYRGKVSPVENVRAGVAGVRLEMPDEDDS